MVLFLAAGSVSPAGFHGVMAAEPRTNEAVCGVGGFQSTPHFLRTLGRWIRMCLPDNDLSDGGGGNRIS